jgi:L-seryl-tRNA(Ser) seleniumtransferase
MVCRHPRELPQLGALWEATEYRELRTQYGDSLVKAALQEAMAEVRARLLEGGEVDLSGLHRQVNDSLAPSYARVINATGTVLHTNLGRAPLGPALKAVAEELDGYSALEYDLSQGRRGKRGEAVERRLRWLTGSPAALVVNNCAAAMILLLTAHAKDREVIVSRGELVEIGGGFRIPDILAMSGAKLVEVGTTNRTRIADYRQAISDQTALMLTTHSSNFRMVGFTQAPTPQELLALGQESGIPIVFDLGSGMLTPVVEGEPSVAEAARFPLCAFSGDKLLGGPQCGILLGHPDLVEGCRRHPLFRALRCDKITLALLEETLRRHAVDASSLPTVELLGSAPEALRERAEALEEGLGGWDIQVLASRGQVGGGSLPGGTLDSWCLSLSPPAGRSAADLHAALRQGRPAVVCRIEKGRLILDLKAVTPRDDKALLRRLNEVFT